MELIPRNHLVRRYQERLEDIALELGDCRPFLLHGVLVVSEKRSRPDKFLSQGGWNRRFVLAPRGCVLVGITYIPLILCHGALSSRADGNAPITTGLEVLA